MRSRQEHRLARVAAALWCVCAAPGARAVERIWTGGDVSDGNWSRPDNWGGTAPAGGETLQFIGDTRLAMVNDLPADTSFAGLTFSNAVNNGFSGSYTLTGNRLTLGGNFDVGVPNVTGWSGTISDTIALDLVLNGNRTLTTRNNLGVAHNLTVTGVIGETGGARALIKAGGGMVWLLGLNTFSGQMQINRNTVLANTLANVGAPSSIGTGGGTAAIRIGNNSDNGTLDYIGASAASTDRPVQVGSGTVGASGGGIISANGGGALTFTAAAFNSPWGATAMRTLQLGGTNTGANAIQGRIADNTASALRLAKNDGGRWTLAGSNTFSGPVAVNAGALIIKHGAALGSASLVSSNGTTVAADAALIVDGSAGGFAVGPEPLVLEGNGGGKGALQSAAGVNVWGGPITLTNSMTYIGSYGGGSLTLDVTNGNAISGACDLYLRADGGSMTIADPVDIGAKALTKAYTSSVTFTAPVTYGSLTMLNGLLSLVNIPDAPMYIGNGNNTCTLRYTGAADVSVTNGFTLGNTGNSDGNSKTVVENESASGVLFLGGPVTVVGSSTKDQVIRLGGGSAASNTVAGAIADGASGQRLSVEKVGAGTWVLAGSNTYSGGTAVFGGALLVNGSAGSGGAGVTNATLGGAGVLAGPVTVGPGGSLAPGGPGATPAVLSCASNLTLAAGCTNRFDCAAGANDQVAVAGALSVLGAGVVELVLEDPSSAPARVPVISFGALSGGESLASWRVTGVDTNKYTSHVERSGNWLVVVNAPFGTVLSVR